MVLGIWIANDLISVQVKVCYSNVSYCILASGILILTVQQFTLQEIAEAYDVLSNAEKKLTYDRYGDVRGASGAFRRPSQSNGASYQEFRQFHTIDPFEIFRSFFGGTDPFRSDHFRQEFYNTISWDFIDNLKECMYVCIYWGLLSANTFINE